MMYIGWKLNQTKDLIVHYIFENFEQYWKNALADEAENVQT